MAQENDIPASDKTSEIEPAELLDQSVLDSLITAAMKEEGAADTVDHPLSEQANLDGIVASGSAEKAASIDAESEAIGRSNKVFDNFDTPSVEVINEPPSPGNDPPDEDVEGEALTDEMVAALVAAANANETPEAVPDSEKRADAPLAPPRPAEPPVALEPDIKLEKQPLLSFLKDRSLHRADLLRVISIVLFPTLSFFAGYTSSNWWMRNEAPNVPAAAENVSEVGALSEPLSTSAEPAAETPMTGNEPIPESSSSAWSPPAAPIEGTTALETPPSTAVPAPPPTQEIKPTPVSDPKFDALQAAFDKLPAKASASDLDGVLDQVNAYIDSTPAPSKTPQAMFLKAQLYAKKGLPLVAYDAFHSLLMRYPDEPDRDKVLFAAAKAASGLRRYLEGANLLEALLQRFPNSPVAGEAEMLLGDAYLSLGRVNDASAVFERALRTAPDPSRATLAVARLGKIALEQHRVDDAIKLLESRPSIDPAVDGNDLIRLNLARAYRAAGRQTDARHMLNELISFFPQSGLLPDAYNELSLLLEEMGLRPEALQVARQAIQQFPDKPACMMALGKLLIGSGEKREGADRLYQAELAGAKDPESLLTAARTYMAAEAYPEGEKAYERLLAEYGDTPQAHESNVELADALYKNGEPKKAVQRLEDLASITSAGPRKLPVLIGLGKIYRDLGLTARAAQIFGEVATMSTEPEVLAQAAVALLNAGEAEEALKLAGKIDLTKVAPDTSHALLVKSSEVQLEKDPKKGVETLEKATSPSPSERAAEDDRRLLAAYVAADNPDRIEKLVARLESHVKDNPVDAPRLRNALVVWGDFLFDKREYADAAKTFGRAIELGDAKDRETIWAQFQCANACFQTGDYDKCLPLYDQVGTTDAPCAKQSRVQAECVRLRQRVQKALNAAAADARETKPASSSSR